jgi:hypothetical protein
MPEQLVERRTGLFTTRSVPVPLSGVSIAAELSSLCARVVITQRYVNRESTPIEAVYLFPLDDTAAVCGFEALVDGTLVVGEVKEREAAFRRYDEAMERGDGAFLLDEERADVFQASVGNLPPGKEALLRITYVSELAVDGKGLRFTVPTTVAPRYAPAEDRLGVGRPDSETLNPPAAWKVPYGMDLTVDVTMPQAITRIESASHPVSVSTRGNTARVSLSHRHAALDRDFVLSIEASGLDRPHAWVERGDDGSETVALAFVPILGDTPSPSEIVFLVDRSGSMAGTSIEEVRNALQLCLRSMIPGCAFNIAGFGSTHEALFEKSRSYDEKSLAQASTYVADLAADLGGTEILPALKAVLERPHVGSLPRQVIVLTDGEVSNTDAVLELVRGHAAAARVFAFGIGASPSRHLVNGLARAGGGAAEFIHPGERIEPTIVRQFGRLLSPALTNVSVKWEGLEVVQSPSMVPPIFAGDRLLMYGFAKPEHRSQSARARLTADSPSGPLTFDAAIDSTTATTGRTVGPLAARARIRELEESPAWLTQRGSRQSARKTTAVTGEIISLSTRYGVLSRETSFVAIERRDTPVEGDIQLRRIPIAIPKGWGSVEDTADTMVGRMMAASAGSGGRARLDKPLMDQAPGSTLDRFDRSSAGAGPGSAGGGRAWSFSRMLGLSQGPSSDPRRKLPSQPTGLHALVKLQRADGSWELTQELADIIGRSFADLDSVRRTVSSGRNGSRAWATALALAWLARFASKDAAVWRMLGAKATAWLDAVVDKPASGKDWMEEAASFLDKATQYPG